MLQTIMRWFEPVVERYEYRSSDYAILSVILTAGTLVRFWGLGNVGLHGDEEIMALATTGLLESGEPLLPSGMFYARALAQIYMMAGSVAIFGESEWAFRLPSAIVGSCTGIAAYFMGRRFLSPEFNLAFVATVTFLPGMIEISQTARMYVFFVTCIIWFAACLFRWEGDQKISSLSLALFVWFLGLHFQVLAIFAAPLFLFPAVSRGSWSLLAQGILAFVAGALAFKMYGDWISDKYPALAERPPEIEEVAMELPIDALASSHEWLMIATLVAAAAFTVVALANPIREGKWQQLAPILLLGAGLVAMSLLHYHAGVILLAFGIVFGRREESLPRAWMILAVTFAAILGIFHLYILHNTGLYPGRKLIGSVVGTPSVWPILRFVLYSPLAGALYAVAFAKVLIDFANRRPIPLHVAFFVMGVWVPLLMLGYFGSYIPLRYASGQLGYFLLCAFAGLMMFLVFPAREERQYKRIGWATAVLTAVSVGFINPVALARVVNPGYDVYPDHKGAAQFVSNATRHTDAIVVAEDVLQQTYYLKSVDYSLRAVNDAVVFSFMRDGQMYDQYTGAPNLGTGAELDLLLGSSEGKAVYIIGSGENWVGDYRMFREFGIAEVLQSNRLEVVYEGRDGKTKVWKLR